MTIYRFNSTIDNIARIFTVIAIAVLPFSPVLNNFFVISIVLTLFGGQLTEKYQIACSYKMNWAAVVLILLLGIGLFYNPYGLGMGLHYFKKYLHILITPLFLIPLFINPWWRRFALNAFLLGAVVSVITWFAILLFFPHVNNYNPYDPISYSMYLAFVSFVLLHRFCEEKNYRIFYLTSLILIVYCLFFVNVERTGMLVFVCLLAVGGLQRWKIKGLILASIFATILASGFYLTSSTMRHRVNEGIQEATSPVVTSSSSIGLRELFFKYGIAHVKQSPLFGHGTGLYLGGQKLAAGMIPQSDLNNRTQTTENSYLNFTLQIGLVGLIALLFWIILQYYESFRLAKNERFLAQGIITSFVVASFCGPVFIMNLSASLYILMLTVLISARKVYTDSECNVADLRVANNFKTLWV